MQTTFYQWDTEIEQFCKCQARKNTSMCVTCQFHYPAIHVGSLWSNHLRTNPDHMIIPTERPPDVSSTKVYIIKYVTDVLHIEGILPKGPYLPCVSMAGSALLVGYHQHVPYMSDLNRRRITDSIILRWNSKHCIYFWVTLQKWVGVENIARYRLHITETIAQSTLR